MLGRRILSNYFYHTNIPPIKQTHPHWNGNSWAPGLPFGNMKPRGDTTTKKQECNSGHNTTCILSCHVVHTVDIIVAKRIFWPLANKKNQKPNAIWQKQGSPKEKNSSSKYNKADRFLGLPGSALLSKCWISNSIWIFMLLWHKKNRLTIILTNRLTASNTCIGTENAHMAQVEWNYWIKPFFWSCRVQIWYQPTDTAQKNH